MDGLVKSLYNLASLSAGSFPVLSPTLERLSILEPLKAVPDDFRILLDVQSVKQEEVEITMKREGLIYISITEGLVKDPAGLWRTQWSNYEIKLPPKFRSQELCVEWTSDNYLLIQPTLITKSYREETRLIPLKVCRTLHPFIKLKSLRSMFESIKDDVDDVLRYFSFESYKMKSRSNIPSDGPSLIPQDMCDLDEAHCRLIRVECSKHVPKCGEQQDTEVTEVSGENKGRDTEEESIRLFREVEKVVSRLEKNPTNDRVKEIFESLGEENLQNAPSKYAEVILLLLGRTDESNRQAITSAPAVLSKTPETVNLDLSAVATDKAGVEEATRISSPAKPKAGRQVDGGRPEEVDLPKTPVKRTASADLRRPDDKKRKPEEQSREIL